MKKILPFFLLCYSVRVSAQTPFMVMDSINANNINALALVHGDMWWKPGVGPHCKFPNGTNKNINFTSAIWMSGYDAGGQLHVSAQTYRQDGNDYWPGPLDGSGALDYATSEKWAKIWKVTRAEVNTFKSTPGHTLTNTPESILTWPGKGNTHAKGKDGVAINVTSEMAPFVDLDGDGKYEPLKGEYPDFRGEQVLWWVFSDNGATHSQSDGLPLKVEVHAMAYAIKRNTLIDNVVYYDYTIINRSTENYHDFRFALWSEGDLGYYLDDFLGFDSSRRMGITYNATNNDGGAVGNPSNSYGLNPPAMGVTMVHLPGDVGSSYVSAGSFLYFNNDPSIIGNPDTATEFNNYMRAMIRNGAHLQHLGQDVNYIFPVDPSIPGGWSECSIGNNPGDRRFVLASNDFTLDVGQKQRIVMALVVDSIGTSCPNANFSGIREVADTAWAVYHSMPTGIDDPNVSTINEVFVYPNPAHDKLIIDCSKLYEDASIRIYNMVGQQIGESLCKRGAQNVVDISSYPTGMYIVSYLLNSVDRKLLFMKQ